MATAEALQALERQGVGGSAHHPLFPPSASERWLTCTASPLPITKLPYQGDKTSWYAAEGTLAHQVFEAFVCEPHVWSFDHGKYAVGTQHRVDGYDLVVDEEMHRSATECWEYIHSVDVFTQWQGEQRVGFPVVTKDDRTTLEGTLDFMAWGTRGALHIFDLKYGKGVRVDAQLNTQMMLYALGAIYGKGLQPDSIVTLHIMQPRLGHFDSWRVSVSNLSGFLKREVTPAVEAVLSDTGVFAPSEKACRWCPLSGQCEAQAKDAFADFDDGLPVIEGVLDNEQLAYYLNSAEQVESWIAALRETALKRIMAGQRVSGYKLVEGRSVRKWDGAPPDEFLELCDLLGIEPTKEPEYLSPAQAQQAIGKRAWREGDLDRFVTKPKGKPTLARDTDPRAAWRENLEDLFGDLD